MSRPRIVIEPGSANRHYWRELWNYRSLLVFMAWRDVMVRYKQTAIGILWGIIRPLLTIGAMWAIGWIFGSTVPGNVPRILLVCAATLPWQFFASAFGETSQSLISNSNLLTKVWFPRMVLPLGTLLVSLIDLAIACAIMVVLMIWYTYLPGPEVFLLPLFLVLATVAALGAGLLMAALNVKYRDFRYIVPFIVQFGLYVTPVAFTSDDVFDNPRIPELLKYIYACNPMVGVIDGFRYSFFGGVLHWQGVMISTVVSVLLLIAGVTYFRKTERAFADVI